MKVILLQDVKKVGKKNEVIDVSDGYATNFLIPRKLAVAYTDKNISQLEANKAKLKAEDARHKEEAIVFKKALEDSKLKFILKIGESGKAFGTITAKNIEEEIKAKLNIVVDRKKFINFSPLKELGPATLKIELYKDVIATFNVVVVSKE